MGETGKVQVHEDLFEDGTVNQHPPTHHPLDASYFIYKSKRGVYLSVCL
jgi:hypothetical protein